MILSFADAGTEDIFNGVDSRPARSCGPKPLWPIAQRKLTQINAVSDVQSLAVPPGNRLEALRADRSGQHSIRINERYRACFRWRDDGVHDVEIVDYH